MSRDNAKMSKIRVKDNLVLYLFSDDEKLLDNSIYALIQGERALLLDAAYPEFARRAKEDLDAQGIAPEVIVLSHYHPDHVSGCPALPDSRIFASEFYADNMRNCRIWEPDFTYLVPFRLVRDGDTLAFGDFELQFLHAPGHSKCGLITRIDKDTLHVGDLVMISRDGKAALPLITDGGDFGEHIRSLRLLEELDPERLLVPHGGVVEDKDEIREIVADRVHYLEKMRDSRGELPARSCLKNDISTYAHLEFHDSNTLHFL